MKWHNKDRITMNNWAYYETSFDRMRAFITMRNDCILLYCTHVAVMQNTPYKVVHILENETYIFHVKLPIYGDFIDQVSNGLYIFAKSRSYYMESPSSYIIHPDGTIANVLQFGDCISHIQIDSYDHIWVGYNVIGRYEQLGWTKETTYSKHGILAFNQQGEIVWSANKLDITRCFAMNIGHDEYYFYAQSVNNFIHLVKQNDYCTYECEEENIVQFITSVEKTLIVMTTFNEMKRLIRDEYTFKVGQLIELIDEKGNLIDGEILMRNNTIICLADETIYRLNLH